MLRHVVMWKLKNFAEGHSRPENAALIREKLESLPEKIPEIIRLEVGFDIVRSEGSYDLVLIGDFDDISQLERYQRHPEHVKVAEFVARVRESRTVVDFEV